MTRRSALFEREPQPLTATPHADGARTSLLGSGGPSRSENAAPAALIRAGLDAPTQWGDVDLSGRYRPVADPDARRDER